MLSKRLINSADRLMAKHRRAFSWWLYYAKRVKNIEKKIIALENAAQFSSNFYCGFLACDELEAEVLKISQTIHCDLPSEYIPNSFLHVFTQVYLHGGHTRAAERWIEFSPEEQQHSVVILRQDHEKIPQALYHNTEQRHGKVTVLEGSRIEKAKQLRQLASGFQHVVLHTHPFDVISLLAFGTEEFQRPVALFNHSDHTFWTGVSIADAVINFRHFEDSINVQRRGVDRNLYLPLPIPQPEKPLEQKTEQMRQTLEIPEQAKVVLTMASPYKYTNIEGYDFIAAVRQLLETEKQVIFIAIGPSEREIRWQKLKEQYPEQVRLLGIIPSDQLLPYLAVSDVVWDSFPSNSFTALLDSAKLGKNILSLLTEEGSMEIFEQAHVLCADIPELITKTQRVIHGDVDESNLVEFYLNQYHYQEGWLKYLDEAVKQIPAKHRLYHCAIPANTEISDMERLAVVLEKHHTRRLKRFFPASLQHLWMIWRYKDGGILKKWFKR